MLRCLILIFTLLFPLTTWAAAMPDSLGFAKSLANEGDHYRAITEYKRFIFQNPKSPLIPQARLSIAKSLLSGKRWVESDNSFENLFTLHPDSSETRTGIRLYADSAYEQGNLIWQESATATCAKSRKMTRSSTTVIFASVGPFWNRTIQNRQNTVSANSRSLNKICCSMT